MGAACHKDAGQAAQHPPPHYVWLKTEQLCPVWSEGKVAISSFVLLLNTDTHQCSHSGKHMHICSQCKSWMWIRTWTKGNSAHTFLPKYSITSHAQYTYQSILRGVYITIDKQARSEMATFQKAWTYCIVMPHTDSAPLPKSWLISLVKMFSQ